VAKAPGLLSCLRHRDYRRLIAAFTLSDIGTWAYNVALAVWIYDATGSVSWVAASTVCRFVPALVFSSYAGVVADRIEKIRLMSVTDLTFAGLMAALATLMMLDGPVWAVLAIAAISSTLGTVYDPAAAGMTPLVVPERDLASANAFRNTIDNVTVIAGPAMGALLLLTGPPEVAVWINAATFALSAALVSSVRARSSAVDVTEGGEQGVLTQMLVGARAILSSPTVAVMVGYSVLATLVFGIDTVLFISVSDEILGTGPDGYGYLLAGLGVGGILASSLVTRVESRPALGPVIIAGMAGYCLPTLVLLVSESPTVAFAAQVLRGASTLVVDVLAVTAMQRALPSDVVARVFGAFNTLMLAAILVGSVGMSWVIAAFGVDAAIWVAGAGTFGLSLLGLPWLREMDRLGRERRQALAPRIVLIESLDLFEQVPDGGLSQLASAAEEVDVSAGTAVVRQGEPANAFYIVASGRLSVSATSSSGERIAAPDLGPGDYFGEIGLIEQIPRTADVVASTDVSLLRIEGSEFLDILTAAKPSSTIIDGAALRLRRTHPALALQRSGLSKGETS
jgi:predicted MFS family arabinose efflux permease